MKKRLHLTPIIERIQRLGISLGNVFSYADLCNLISAGSPLKNTRMINRLIHDGVLIKIRRGIYTTKAPDLWVLAGRSKKNTCISMDSVLAKNGLVGTVPERSVSAVSASSRRQTISTPFGLIRIFSIRKDLLNFGTLWLENGVQVADSEKAYLDLLYYATKGARFVFDPRCEIDVKKLDIKKIEKYLKHYRNPKFVQFVKGLLYEIT